MSVEVYNNVLNELAHLDLEELKSINRFICDKVNHQVKIRAMNAACSFNVGDKVKWEGKHGAREGIITKVKSKNIDVDAGANGKWIVTATLLQKNLIVT